MGGFLRWVGRSAALLLAAAGAAGGAVWWAASRSLPEYDGEAKAPGLTAPVEILRDSHAVPHVFGENEADAWFGLGYAHAQDRLWQMAFQRRAAQGRLAEILGRSALPLDAYMRSLDLQGRAEASLAALSPETRAVLEAYAKGVNARLAEIRAGGHGRGAPEFYLHPAPPEDWRPADSVALLKYIALGSSGAQAREVLRARALARLTPAEALTLFPPEGAAETAPEPALPAPAPAPSSGPAPADRGVWLDLAPAVGLAALVRPEASGASNVWAVDDKRAAARAPLMANDPHVPFSTPAPFYLARLEAPGLSVIGATAPGIPAILYGRNRRVAWGAAALGADDADLFIERLSPDDPNAVTTPEGPRPLKRRIERFGVAGESKPREIPLAESGHGPILPIDAFDLAAVTPEGHLPALSWTGLARDDATLEGYQLLARAGSLEGALRAAPRFVAPAMSLVLADEGAVAMVTAGRIPVRPEGSRSRGYLPTPGWTGEGDWIGFMPLETTPRTLKPEKGVLVAANARIGDSAYPNHISFDWDGPWRFKRIEKLLARGPQTLASFRAIQNDVGSEAARELLTRVALPLWRAAKEAPAESEPKAIRRRAALDLLVSQWTGDMSAHAPEPLIYHVWMDKLFSRLAGERLGDLAGRVIEERPAFLARIYAAPDSEAAKTWCDSVGTAPAETCADQARAALDAALEELSARYGPDMAAWRWGKAHPAIQAHRPLGEARLFGVGLGWIFDIVQPAGGDDHSVNRTLMTHEGPLPYAALNGAAYRGIYDFADPDRSLFAISTGQSGHFLSRFYTDFAPLWAAGDYAPMSLAREDIEAGRIGRLRLSP